MTAHRYWALGVVARPGSGNGVSVAECEMRTSVGGPDVTGSGTPGGYANFGLVAANAFDNNVSTYWHNASTGGRIARLEYDFGSPVDIVEMWFRAPGSAVTYGGAVNAPYRAFGMWSDDGTTWVLDGSGTNTFGMGDDGEAVVSGINGGRMSARGFDPVGMLRLRRALIGGTGRIEGDTKVDSLPDFPVRRRVRLFRQRDARCIDEVWSNPNTGAFEFIDLDPAELYVVESYDHTNTHNAVIADRIQPDVV